MCWRLSRAAIAQPPCRARAGKLRSLCGLPPVSVILLAPRIRLRPCNLAFCEVKLFHFPPAGRALRWPTKLGTEMPTFSAPGALQ